MFNEVIKDRKIPPNFLNSILTNPSLYDMFKNDFESNREYFQGKNKEEYLEEMLWFLEDTLFSSNIFHIYYGGAIEEISKGKLDYIKTFYDDFLLDAFRENPENILKTRLFKGFKFAMEHDEHASQVVEFQNLYEYVFKESLDYYGIVKVLIKEAVSKLLEGEELTFKEFDIICNYVKNNVFGRVDMEIVTGMLHNHSYKTNHIFDREVASQLVSSTIKSYLESFNIEVNVVFQNGLESREESEHDLETNTIYIDYSLIEEFLSLNYVELFERAFYEAEIVKISTLLRNNRCDFVTLKTIMDLLIHKVDLERIFVDKEYNPSEFLLDIRATSFVKTLRFFSMFGVNLFNSYFNSKTSKIDFDDELEEDVSKKSISLDIRFSKVFARHPKKSDIVKKYSALKTVYNTDGTRKKTIDLIKNLKNEDTREFIIEYLHSRIIEPDSMVEDVIELSSYKPRDTYLKEFIETELKYIYVDTFYYSLESYIKMNKGKFDIEEYLGDLLVKINCINDTPLTHRFKDEAILTIDEMKQS